jgi:hypothetical protein
MPVPVAVTLIFCKVVQDISPNNSMDPDLALESDAMVMTSFSPNSSRNSSYNAIIVDVVKLIDQMEDACLQN